MIRRRPASAAALLLSIIWIAVTIYEIAIKKTGDFFPAHGDFIIAYTTLQTAAIGVITFLGFAILIERIWPGPTAGQ
jgi:hypothetical protein